MLFINIFYFLHKAINSKKDKVNYSSIKKNKIKKKKYFELNPILRFCN